MVQHLGQGNGPGRRQLVLFRAGGGRIPLIHGGPQVGEQLVCVHNGSSGSWSRVSVTSTRSAKIVKLTPGAEVRLMSVWKPSTVA
jgi:hypothetical protein